VQVVGNPKMTLDNEYAELTCHI